MKNTEIDKTLNLRSFTAALAAVTQTASKDDTRPHLCAVYMRTLGANLFELVSTDGHRLTSISFECASEPGDLWGSVLLPLASAKELLKICKPIARHSPNGELHMSASDMGGNRVYFSVSGVSSRGATQPTTVNVDFRYSEEAFVPHNKVVPREVKREAEETTIDASYLMQAGKIWSDVCKTLKEDNPGLSFGFSGDRDPICFTSELPGNFRFTHVIMPRRGIAGSVAAGLEYFHKACEWHGNDKPAEVAA